MDLQGFYDSVTQFWNTIHPLLLAHLIFLAAWLWMKRGRIDLLSWMEGLLKSKLYKRWKKVLDEFQLRSTLPYLSILLMVVYLVIVADALDFIAGGLLSPLSIVYTETDFWVETNNGVIVDEIQELHAYQGDAHATLWDVYNFKRRMLEAYQMEYPEQYKSLFDWRGERLNIWNRYYQLAIASFVIVSILLLPAVNKRITALSVRRLYVVWLVSLLFIPFTRYQTEQVIEDKLHAELIFVNGILKQDPVNAVNKLSLSEQDEFLCVFYDNKRSEMQRIETAGDSRQFWLSRYLEPVFLREFTTAPQMWQPPADCAGYTP